MFRLILRLRRLLLLLHFPLEKAEWTIQFDTVIVVVFSRVERTK